MSKWNSDVSRLYLKRKLLLWSKDNSRKFPWRQTKDPYRICVAEIMLHQTFARKVVPVYKAFIGQYPNIKQLSKARVLAIERLIYPLGFIYRARRLKEIAQYVVQAYGGKFPLEKNDLLSLPGVGDYTAASIMCFAHGKQVPIIDANVIRVYSRYFGIKVVLPNSAPNREILEVALKALPRGKARAFNYGLLDFAAVICTHYNPKHEQCPVRSKCKLFTKLR